MSGLFTAHVFCSSCGLTGSPFDMAPPLTEVCEQALPTAQDSPPRFDVIVVPLEPEQDYLDAIARNLSSPACQVAVPKMHTDGRILLVPPLRCPRCQATVSEAILGRRPTKIHEATSLDQIVAQTHDRSSKETRRFQHSNTRIICMPFSEEGRQGNQWRIVRAPKGSTNPLDVAKALITILERSGSRCDEPRDLGSRSDFIEWVDEG